jgi:hypothetical protein
MSKHTSLNAHQLSDAENDPYSNPSSVINAANAAATVTSAVTANTDEQTNPFDIFSNPQIQRAKESLTPQMRAQYEQLGESIWSQMEASQMSISNSTGENVNFTGENLPPPVEEAAAHIAEALKSGMHPSLLDEDEKKVMTECFGTTWWRKWDYQDDEMKQTV